MMVIFDQTHVLLPRQMKAKTSCTTSCGHAQVCLLLLYQGFTKCFQQTAHFLYGKKKINCSWLGQLVQLVLEHSFNTGQPLQIRASQLGYNDSCCHRQVRVCIWGQIGSISTNQEIISQHFLSICHMPDTVLGVLKDLGKKKKRCAK